MYNINELKALEVPLDCFNLKQIEIKAKGGRLSIKWDETRYDSEQNPDGSFEISKDAATWVEEKSSVYPYASTAKIFDLLDSVKKFIPIYSDMIDFSEKEKAEAIDILWIKFVQDVNGSIAINIRSQQMSKRPTVTGRCSIEQLTTDDVGYFELERILVEINFFCHQRCVCGVLLKPEEKNIEIGGEIQL